MEFLARHYEDILLNYRFIRAIGVQLNLKSEPRECKRCDPICLHNVGPKIPLICINLYIN